MIHIHTYRQADRFIATYLAPGTKAPDEGGLYGIGATSAAAIDALLIKLEAAAIYFPFASYKHT